MNCQPQSLATVFSAYLREFADTTWLLEQKFWAEVSRKAGWLSARQVREALAKQLDECQQGRLVHLGEIWLAQKWLNHNQVVQLIQESGGQVLLCRHCQFYFYKAIACSISHNCPRCNGEVEVATPDEYPLPAVLRAGLLSTRILSNKASSELSLDDFLFLDVAEYLSKEISQLEEEILLVVQAFDCWLSQQGDAYTEETTAEVRMTGRQAADKRRLETSRVITQRISKALLSLGDKPERKKRRPRRTVQNTASLLPLCSGYLHNLHELLWILQQKVFAGLCLQSAICDTRQLKQIVELQERSLGNGELMHIAKAALKLDILKEKNVIGILQQMCHSLWVCPFCRLSLWQTVAQQGVKCPRCQSKTLKSTPSPEILHKQLAAVLFPLLPILPATQDEDPQASEAKVSPVEVSDLPATSLPPQTENAQTSQEISQILSESGISHEISQFMKSMEHIASDEEIYHRYLASKAADAGEKQGGGEEAALPDTTGDSQATPLHVMQVSEKASEEEIPLDKRMTPLHLLQVRPQMATASALPAMPKSGSKMASHDIAVSPRSQVSRANQVVWLAILLLFPLLSGVWIFFDQYRSSQIVATPKKHVTIGLPPDNEQPKPTPQPDKIEPQPDKPVSPDNPVRPDVPVNTPDSTVTPPPKNRTATSETALQKFLQNRTEPQDIAVMLLHLNKNQLFVEDLALLKELYLRYPSEDQLRQLLVKTAATIGGQEARVWLEELLSTLMETDDKVKIIQALEKVGKAESRKVLLRVLQEDSDSDLTMSAALALGNIVPHDETVYRELVNKFYGTDSERTRHGFLIAISSMNIRDAGQFFIQVVMQDQYSIALRIKALDALSVYALHYKEAAWVQAELSRMSNVPNLILRRKIEEILKVLGKKQE
jgi:phage FluMu protein Com